MDKLNFDINQFLRFLLSGGWAVGCFFFMFPQYFEKYHNGNSVDIILLALMTGSLVYVIHRAVLYPNLLKLVYIILSIFKRMKWDKYFLLPFFPSKREIELDFIRWSLRQTEKSKIKNIVIWGSQVHFIFCAAFSGMFATIIAKEIGAYDPSRLSFVCNISWILLGIGIIDDIRLVLYDLKVIEKEKDLH